MDSRIKELLYKADQYKERIDSIRPLSENEAKSLIEYFRIGVVYAGNAIEGNTLTISETKVLLEDGITVGGKPIRDYYEAIGHSRAYDFMLTMTTKRDAPFTEQQIKKLHRMFYLAIDDRQAGKYRKERVFITGTEYVPPAPQDVPAQMKEFISAANASRDSMHPVEFAAMLHKRLVDIHPFVDGNGRTARLLMNASLVRDGYGIAIIPPIRRAEYMDALRASQMRVDHSKFICLIAECVNETQRDYCRRFGLPIRVRPQHKTQDRDER